PILAVKSGRSEAGRRAASSHTAALASSEVAVDALFAQAGVIRAETMEELFEVAALVANQPAPEGNGLAVLTNAGGPGIMAVDAAEASGLTVATLSAETVAGLRQFLPVEASVDNPVDMIASATAASYRRALELLLADDAVDSALVLHLQPFAEGSSDVAA